MSRSGLVRLVFRTASRLVQRSGYSAVSKTETRKENRELLHALCYGKDNLCRRPAILIHIAMLDKDAMLFFQKVIV